MKKIISFILIAIILVSVPVVAFAEPMRIPSASTSLSFDGTTAYCGATLVEANKMIEATMSLWDGGTCLASWAGRGKSVVSLSGSCEVESGKTYTLQVSGTIDGGTFSAPPMSRTCP